MKCAHPIFAITGTYATIFIFEIPGRTTLGLTQVLHYDRYCAQYTVETTLEDAPKHLLHLIPDLVRHIYLHDALHADVYTPWLDNDRVPPQLSLEWELIVNQFENELLNLNDLEKSA